MIALHRAVAAAAVAMTVSPAAAQVNEVGIPVGSTPPGVMVEDLDGNPVDLGALYAGGGKYVLLEFWATWCENCEALAPQMDAAHERYGDVLELRAVGVGVGQNPRSIKRHLRRHPVAFPTLYDKRGAAVRAFMAPTTSYIVILDPTGTVVYTGVGREQDIDAAIRGVMGTEQ